jgi:hypothetical protein
MSVSRVLCLLLVAQVLLIAYVSLLLIPLLPCGAASMQLRC